MDKTEQGQFMDIERERVKSLSKLDISMKAVVQAWGVISYLCQHSLQIARELRDCDLIMWC